MSTTIVATIQLNSGNSVENNLAEIQKRVAEAAQSGASLVLLPENCAFMGKQQGDSKYIAEPLGNGVVQRAFSACAQRHGLWLLVGSFPTIDDGDIYQTLLVYDDFGSLVAHYHKRHLFDVTLPRGESYRESDAFCAGGKVVTVTSPMGCIGLAICYDVRFPEHFRSLVVQGANIIVVPAAFTYHTGAAHWETLLRARAIENQCFVIASGQVGHHPDGRQTWGHSMVIGPWGEILASSLDEPSCTTALIDMQDLQALRDHFPCLQHRLSKE